MTESKAVISENIKQKLKERFKELIDEVELVLLKKEENQLTQQIKELLEEISSLSEKISFKEEEKECLLNPCIIIKTKEKDFGIRYIGLPAGGEFQNFIDTIFMVSTNNYSLSERTLNIIEMVDKKVEIKVFITKSCGWCPLALKKLYSFALVNDNIFVYGIDCHDFPDFAIKYNVSTVPKIVINDKVEFVGYKEENDILGYIISAVGN
ncbi:glutaredoxin-like protein [Hydrogenothermus marinus]|uniref:Glutaredoxin-like protein n=1 Tax=Hydrogenothermus marinus TaxID=133270 RepID=A0A3M0BQB8_9AQUI|nr:glutaredoxin-like protein [Hydrogenothermus marinus]